MRVAVAGGGPAGALAAERLAAAGVEVVLFDEKLAWEKPCGGGLTAKVYRRYPFLIENEVPKRRVSDIVFSTQGAGSVRLPLGDPLVIYSRKDLNGLLLDRAARAGARLEKARVIALERRDGGWEVRSRAGAVHADFTVIATGARNALAGVRRGPHLRALGYYAPGDQAHIDVQFFPGFEGYIWVFPRCGHVSAGICGRGETAQALRWKLEAYMDARGISRRGAVFYSHLLPVFAPGEIAGPGWLAVGDAAATVDPITGEGIYYALRSGELAAEAILHGGGVAERYAAAVREDFGVHLECGMGLAERFYSGTFAGAALTARMVQFARRSGRFGAILRDLVAGAQAYTDLRRRCYRELPRILMEMAGLS
ncbi:MAG: FAD-dependent oxidoreductase [Bryobacteraceae bacterium]